MPFDATPVELAPECQVLLDAARRIHSCGLWKGGQSAQSPRGGTCAVLSIGFVSENAVNGLRFTAAIERLAAHLGITARDTAGRQRAIFTWNDAPERTAEEVAQALERAAL